MIPFFTRGIAVGSHRALTIYNRRYYRYKLIQFNIKPGPSAKKFSRRYNIALDRLLFVVRSTSVYDI